MSRKFCASSQHSVRYLQLGERSDGTLRLMSLICLSWISSLNTLNGDQMSTSCLHTEFNNALHFYNACRTNDISDILLGCNPNMLATGNVHTLLLLFWLEEMTNPSHFYLLIDIMVWVELLPHMSSCMWVCLVCPPIIINSWPSAYVVEWKQKRVKWFHNSNEWASPIGFNLGLFKERSILSCAVAMRQDGAKQKSKLADTRAVTCWLCCFVTKENLHLFGLYAFKISWVTYTGK